MAAALFNCRANKIGENPLVGDGCLAIHLWLLRYSTALIDCANLNGLAQRFGTM
uniref:Uncharacterized protein n=1 Tax=Picea glauca TaxID=3330 RepID=A0A101M1I4_PICGL|nr:hypothetical protein ABT39_MTgene3793 [Picea glauca]QHR91120.1 hypothetical protein Q903MT_gene5152 [Picea sitchensis]